MNVLGFDLNREEVIKDLVTNEKMTTDNLVRLIFSIGWLKYCEGVGLFFTGSDTINPMEINRIRKTAANDIYEVIQSLEGEKNGEEGS